MSVLVAIMKTLVFLLAHSIFLAGMFGGLIFVMFSHEWGFKLFLVIPLLGLLIGGSWALHRLQTRAGVKIAWETTHFYP